MASFPTNTLCTPLSSPLRATCPAHLIRLDFTTRTILGKEYRSFSSSLCSFLHSPVNSSLLGQNNFLYTLFSNTLSLRSSLNVSDQVSHPYKTTGKTIVLYISIFKFLDSNLEDNRFCTEWQQAFPDFSLLLIHRKYKVKKWLQILLGTASYRITHTHVRRSPTKVLSCMEQ
jgi:hypothetical protein